jgi:hypothetical protein
MDNVAPLSPIATTMAGHFCTGSHYLIRAHPAARQRPQTKHTIEDMEKCA